MPPPSVESRIGTLDLEIQETNFGCLLEWHDEADEMSGRTWHITVEDAMEQAPASFGVLHGEWQTTTPDFALVAPPLDRPVQGR